MKNKGPERRRFASQQEANQHAEKFGAKGTYRFGTDSIVFTPHKESVKPDTRTSARGTREQRMETRWSSMRYGVIDA
jgi:hypothetical protein